MNQAVAEIVDDLTEALGEMDRGLKANGITETEVILANSVSTLAALVFAAELGI